MTQVSSLNTHAKQPRAIMGLLITVAIVLTAVIVYLAVHHTTDNYAINRQTVKPLKTLSTPTTIN